MAMDGKTRVLRDRIKSIKNTRRITEAIRKELKKMNARQGAQVLATLLGGKETQVVQKKSFL